MSYKFNVFEFLSFIIPGLLLLLPLLLMPSWFGGLSAELSVSGGIYSQPLVASIIVLVVSYVFGLFIYYIGRILERRVLERGGAPSQRVLTSATTAALTPPVPDRIRSIARKHFHLTDAASDSQLFSLIFRHLFMAGKAERTARFLHLRNLTRGATVVFFVWSIVAVAKIIITGPRPAIILATLACAALAALADRVRRAYNRDIAEEVYVAYYVHACRPKDLGAYAVAAGNTGSEDTQSQD